MASFFSRERERGFFNWNMGRSAFFSLFMRWILAIRLGASPALLCLCLCLSSLGMGMGMEEGRLLLLLLLLL